MRRPEDKAMRDTMYEWAEAVNEQEKLTQTFLRDALIAVFEGMLSLDDRIASLSGQEWKGVRQIAGLQDELNLQRYKMILLQKAIGEKYESIA